MKRLILTTADWWSELSPVGKQEYIATHPNSRQARQGVNQKIAAQDKQEREAAEAETLRQEEERRKLEEKAEQERKAAAEAAKPPPPPPPVRRVKPPEDTAAPTNTWEHMKKGKK